MSNLTLLPDRLAVCRLPPGAAIPAWATASPFFSLTRTDAELSVVCVQQLVPEPTQCEAGWRVFRVAGPLDFSLTGILAGIAAPLAAAGVSIFAISTFDTDYVLVKEENLTKAFDALRAAGHEVNSVLATWRCPRESFVPWGNRGGD
jgi:hypothetical protein